MDNKIIISVVIPVYNAEKYLPSLFETIENQKIEEVEFIFVDDGSKDDSIKYLQDKMKSIPHARLIENCHGGAPKARNDGMKIAKGKYIWLFDSDDTFGKGIFEKIIPILSQNELDLLFGRAYVVDEEKKVIGSMCCDIEKGYIKDLKRLFFLEFFPGNKIFSRKILEKQSIVFDNVTIHQDMNFCMKALPFCKEVYCIDECMYYYYIHQDSISHNVSKKIAGVVDAIDCTEQFYKDKNLFDTYKKELEYNYIKHILFQAVKVPFVGNSYDCKEICSMICNKIKSIDYRGNPYISKEVMKQVDDFVEMAETYLKGDASIMEKIRNKNAGQDEKRKELYTKIIERMSTETATEKINLWFKKHEIDRICVYGKGSLGMMLYEKIKATDVNVSCFLDRNATNECLVDEAVPVLSLEDMVSKMKLDELQMIVVTPVHVFDDIKNMLVEKGLSCLIVSLEDIV